VRTAPSTEKSPSGVPTGSAYSGWGTISPWSTSYPSFARNHPAAGSGVTSRSVWLGFRGW
jgi:hypothetical protein